MGTDAAKHRAIVSLWYPIEHGIMRKSDDMEKILRCTFFHELRVDPEEHAVLLTDPPQNSKPNREKVAQIMFESFSVPSLSLASQSVLPLYATGNKTGVALDCGETMTCVAPVFDGYKLPDSTLCLNLGGRNLNSFILAFLSKNGYECKENWERDTAREIKEKLCYVALDPKAEAEKAAASHEIDKTYEMPDGKTLTIGNERFLCPEVLFQPTLAEVGEKNVQETLYQSIMKCPVDLRRSMYQNVQLAGGSTLFPGFAERLEKELTALAPSTMKVKVASPPERQYAVWIGGSVLASMSSFEKMWISKEEYKETGPSVVHQKCF